MTVGKVCKEFVPKNVFSLKFAMDGGTVLLRRV